MWFSWCVHLVPLHHSLDLLTPNVWEGHHTNVLLSCIFFLETSLKVARHPNSWRLEGLLTVRGSNLSPTQMEDPILDILQRSQQHHVTLLRKTADTEVETVKVGKQL